MTGGLLSKRLTRHATVWVFLCLAGTPLAMGQSLADVARETRAKRETAKSPSKVYTNDDLTVDPNRAAAPPQPATEPAPQVPAVATAPDTPPAPPNGDAPVKDEKYWRERMQSEREAVRRAQAFAAALQSQINGLWAEFTACQAPPQCNEIAEKRKQSLAELDRVTREVEQRTKAISAIQEEARKAGVPAGWVR